jgi:hypothetical protein
MDPAIKVILKTFGVMGGIVATICIVAKYRTRPKK